MFWYHTISLGIRGYSMNVSPWDREFKLQQACCSERRECEATDAMALHEFHDRELMLLNHVTLSLLGGSLVSRGSRDFWSPIRPPRQRKSGASRLHIPQYMGGDKRPKSHSGKSGTSGVRKGTRTKSGDSRIRKMFFSSGKTYREKHPQLGPGKTHGRMR